MDDEPDEDTGMWKVQPFVRNGTLVTSVVHVRSLVRAAHLLPIFGSDLIDKRLNFDQTLDTFDMYYVNRFIDHNAFRIAS